MVKKLKNNLENNDPLELNSVDHSAYPDEIKNDLDHTHNNVENIIQDEAIEYRKQLRDLMSGPFSPDNASEIQSLMTLCEDPALVEKTEDYLMDNMKTDQDFLVTQVLYGSDRMTLMAWNELDTTKVPYEMLNNMQALLSPASDIYVPLAYTVIQHKKVKADDVIQVFMTEIPSNDAQSEIRTLCIEKLKTLPLSHLQTERLSEQRDQWYPLVSIYLQNESSNATLQKYLPSLLMDLTNHSSYSKTVENDKFLQETLKKILSQSPSITDLRNLLDLYHDDDLSENLINFLDEELHDELFRLYIQTETDLTHLWSFSSDLNTNLLYNHTEIRDHDVFERIQELPYDESFYMQTYSKLFPFEVKKILAEPILDNQNHVTNHETNQFILADIVTQPQFDNALREKAWQQLIQYDEVPVSTLANMIEYTNIDEPYLSSVKKLINIAEENKLDVIKNPYTYLE